MTTNDQNATATPQALIFLCKPLRREKFGEVFWASALLLSTTCGVSWVQASRPTARLAWPAA